MSIPPLGPTSVMVVTNGLQRKFAVGRLLALGSGIGEGIYAGIAFWGSAKFKTQIDSIMPYAQAIGAILCGVIAYGLLTYSHAAQRKKQAEEEDDPSGKGKKPAQGPGLLTLITGISLSGLNPGLIASWAAVTSALGAAGALDTVGGSPVLFSVSVFAGIQLWYTTVLSLLAKYGTQIPDSAVDKAMRATGTLIAIVAGVLAKGAAQYFLFRG